MNPHVAFPFLTLSDEAVLPSPWELSLNGGEWTEVGDHLADWDHLSTIRLRKSVRVSPEIAARDLSTPTNALRLAVGVRIGTGQGRLPRTILERHRQILTSESWAAGFDFEVSSDKLSVILDLAVEVTLASEVNLAEVLAPKVKGARLWWEAARVRIEGDEPRFPIETLDFRRLLGEVAAASSPWYLHWSPRDWDRDFSSAVRLYLNERADVFLERIANHDKPTLQALLADVMSQICERFVQNPNASEMMNGGEVGSLGSQAAIWIRKAWPDRDVEFVRAVLEDRPSLFRSTFLALAELGEDQG